MMITLSSAENVLKEVYLGVIADQINTKTNPLFARIKKSTRNIVGKEVRVVAPIGVDGGFKAGTETDTLPEGLERPYISFVAPLKNLYGRFEISDKAIRSSSSDVGSFVNLIQDSMDSLLKASQINLARMLYGDGSGLICRLRVSQNKMYIDQVDSVLPGMKLDIYAPNSNGYNNNLIVKYVNKATGELILNQTVQDFDPDNNARLFIADSKDKEIVGLRGIVSNATLYGVTRADYPVLNAKTYTGTNSTAFDEDYVQKIVDDLESDGTSVNFINCSYALKQLYQKYLTLYKKNIAYTTLEEGMKVITHFGIPIVPTYQLGSGEAYFLNTDDFTFYQLDDWRWLEDESGRILKQAATKPTYAATLVKYTELICQKPSGVAYCSNIPTSVIS